MAIERVEIEIRNKAFMTKELIEGEGIDISKFFEYRGKMFKCVGWNEGRDMFEFRTYPIIKED